VSVSVHFVILYFTVADLLIDVQTFVVEDRVSAAKSLIARLGKSRCSKIIEETNRLCVAYIELANYNVDKFKGKNGGKFSYICIINNIR